MTYATIVTAALFFILGGIAALSFEAWMDGRAIAARRQMAAKKRETLKNLQPEVDDTDAAMDEAVALAQSELGATILSYEKI